MDNYEHNEQSQIADKELSSSLREGGGLLRTPQYKNLSKKLNSVALVRERTLPTERSPLVGGEVIWRTFLEDI
jgi:hypothetical protein